MKLSKLLLQAFGPFTDTVLDFSASPANLHLIYGPNEAGKSSALRAMTDLRFGIPTRSPDDFIHPFNQLRIGGVFIDESGESVGLLRRKGRGATLSLLDESGQAAPAAHERALTGGLERGEFEAMFGLNHARLRAGGDLLLKGEGELGAALFEASAGTQGIAAILAELEADAKKFHNPHGAAKSAVINEARRQLDEQRQALRLAQTKPAEWQSLQRVHETAQAALAELDLGLETQRRRDNELAELRNVEPLLREHDRMQAEWDALGCVPDLPENAREERLAAELALRHADENRLQAEAEIAQCNEILATLSIEPALLEHAAAIERLAAGVEPMARSRLEIRRQQAAVERLQADLNAAADRIGDTVEALIRALPSAADRAALNRHLDDAGELRERLASDRQQADKLDKAIMSQQDDAPVLPEPAARRALEQALRQAQALGDVERQTGEADRKLGELESQLNQTLADLGLDSVEALRRVQPLLDAEIAQARQDLSSHDKAAQRLRDEDALQRRHQEERRLELRQLSAAGEVVTADTLRLARARRDEHWRQVRTAYVEKTLAAPGDSWADRFETLLAEADRQADLLRADTKRAAEFEVCTARIEDMQRRRDEIATELQILAEHAETLNSGWARRLEQSGLPPLPAEALREWQNRRHDALSLADRLSTAQAERQRLLADARRALSDLTAALRLADQDAAERANTLPALIGQALTRLNAVTTAQAKHEERVKAARALAEDRDEIARCIEAHEARWQIHHAALQDRQTRLLLPPDSPPEAIKARLEELDGLSRQAAALAEARFGLQQHQAVVDEFAAQAEQLAALLGEPAPAQADDFAERLRKRLSLSIEAELERKSQQRNLAKALKNQQIVLTEQARKTAVLARLCAAAGVADVAELPNIEALAAQKREAHLGIQKLRQQLAQATRPEAELRQALAGLDAIRLDADRERCKAEIARLEQAQASARQAEEQTRRALEAIDASDLAARAREAMEAAAERYRAALRPWARLRLAHALLAEALGRFRERAQAPMVAAASGYFEQMTGGRYPRLLAEEQDGKPVLRALRTDGASVGVEAMSEGTADQLYLGLRLAALALRRASHPLMPLVLDDVLITSDDERAVNILRALACFAEGGQVMLFTHHRHLIELAGAALGEASIAIHHL
jgi:uncharacterized protein YhaN